MSRSTEKNILRLLLVRIPTSVLTLGYTILLARMLQPELFGVYQYMQTNIQLLIMMLGLNAASGLVYYASHSEHNITSVQRLAGKLLALGVSIVVIAMILAGIFPPIYRFLIPNGRSGWFWPVFFILSYTFQKAALFFESLIKGSNAFGAYNKGTLFAASASVAFYAVGFALAWTDDRAYFLLILAAQAAGALYFAYLWIKYDSGPTARSATPISIRSYWSYIRSGYAGQLTRFLNKRFDVWLIESMIGVVSLGYYQLATSFNQFVLNAIQPANQMLMKHLQPDKLNTELFTRHVRVLSTAVFLGSGALILLFPYLIPLLFGESYRTAITPAQILALTSYFVFLTNSLALYNYTHKKLRFTWYAQLLGLVVIVILDFLLIPDFGIIGAAWASFFSYGISAVFMVFTVPRSLKLPIHHFLIPRPNDLKAFLK